MDRHNGNKCVRFLETLFKGNLLKITYNFLRIEMEREIETICGIQAVQNKTKRKQRERKKQQLKNGNNQFYTMYKHSLRFNVTFSFRFGTRVLRVSSHTCASTITGDGRNPFVIFLLFRLAVFIWDTFGLVNTI